MDKLSRREIFELRLLGFDIPLGEVVTEDDLKEYLPKEIDHQLDKNCPTRKYSLEFWFDDMEEHYREFPEDRFNPLYKPMYYAAYKGCFSGSSSKCMLKAIFDLLLTSASVRPDVFNIHERVLSQLKFNGKMNKDLCWEILDGIGSFYRLFIPTEMKKSADEYYERCIKPVEDNYLKLLNEYRQSMDDSKHFPEHLVVSYIEATMIRKETLDKEIERHIDNLYFSYCAEEKKKREQEKTEEKRRQYNTKTYLMLDDNTGYIKIGRSINPRKREKTLQSEKPTISMFAICNIDVEHELHVKYADKNIRGEWFALTEEDISYICRTYNFYEYEPD